MIVCYLATHGSLRSLPDPVALVGGYVGCRGGLQCAVALYRARGEDRYTNTVTQQMGMDEDMALSTHLFMLC